jgi:hypothetical protein
VSKGERKRKSESKTEANTVNTMTKISAESFLDQAIQALTVVDAPALQRLESAAHTIAPPIDPTRYLKERAVFVALLGATGRNLRLLRRVSELRTHTTYAH